MYKIYNHKAGVVSVSENKIKRITLAGLAVSLSLLLTGVTTATAASLNVVTSSNPQGWNVETVSGGNVTYVNDPTAPYGDGSLLMTTVDDKDSVASIINKSINRTALAEVTELSYYTKQDIDHIGSGYGIELAALEWHRK